MGLLSFNYCVSELDVFAFRKKNDNDYAGKHAGFLYPEAGASFIHLFSSSSPLYFYFCLKNSSFYFLDIVCRGPSEQQSLRPHAYWNSQVFFFLFFLRGCGVESSFRLWSPTTGSVALIAQVADQIKESTVMPRPQCDRVTAVGWQEGGRQGQVSVQSVYQYFFSSLLSICGSCCFNPLVQKSVLNCIDCAKTECLRED